MLWSYVLQRLFIVERWGKWFADIEIHKFCDTGKEVLFVIQIDICIDFGEAVLIWCLPFFSVGFFCS